MATLRNIADGRLSSVISHLRIGRAADSGLRLQQAFVSAEHALLRWTGEGWEVKDLGSRNGTFVDGKRLDRGQSAPIDLGSRIAFGDFEETWELVDASAPAVLAISLDGEETIEGKEGLLVLPSEADPELSVFRDGQGNWVIENAEGGVEPIEDRAVLESSRGRFRLFLPSVLEGTPLLEVTPTIGSVELRFKVSRDEETVELSILHRGREIPLEPQWHGYVLLTLARLRKEAADLPAEERGWVARDTLLKMLRMDSNGLNVAIHKAREQLLAAGIQGAAAIVEVRRGQRRFGTDRFEVVRL